MLIKGKKLTYTYKKAKAPTLKDISFEIKRGETVFFLGRSGSGKTTLLKCLVGILPDFHGLLESPSGSFNRGFVSQQYHLFPHMTVLQNCIHPQVHVLQRSKKEARLKAEQLLDSLGIVNLRDKYPSSLSGGQQQRVAIARSLCMDSELLFLDEPTSALDPTTTNQLKDLLCELKERGITLVISTHDMDFVKRMMEKVYLMVDGEIVASYDSSLDNLQSQSPIYQYVYGENNELT